MFVYYSYFENKNLCNCLTARGLQDFSQPKNRVVGGG